MISNPRTFGCSFGVSRVFLFSSIIIIYIFIFFQFTLFIQISYSLSYHSFYPSKTAVRAVESSYVLIVLDRF